MRQDTKTDLYSLINTVDSIDDLDIIKDMVKSRKLYLSRKTRLDLAIGEEVTISGSNKIENGKIIKINRTRAVVDCYDKSRDSMIHYTVPFSRLES